MRQDGEGYGLFRRRRQAKLIGKSQTQSEWCEFVGQHGDECGVFRSSSGKDHFLERRLPREK